MSKVIFYHGVMNASKSAQLLMTNHNYTSTGRETVLIKPDIDNRNGSDSISSRIGINAVADWVLPVSAKGIDRVELVKIIILKCKDDKGVSAILVDESQFFSKETIKELILTARQLDIQIMFYGLLKNFQNELFEGSKALVEEADSIIEIKTTCIKCERKATCNIRLVNGSPVYEGNEVEIGGNESYVSVCANHYYNFED